jgi:HlyD family secretion protein
LIFNQGGLQVAVINENKSVHLQPVTVYRDFGATIELSDGLRGGENIVLSPPTNLQEGGKVKVTSEQKIAETAK